MTAFTQYPDAVITTRFPGVGTVLAAWILGEIGDDRTRFADAKALKAFAGTAPVTRASGLERSVTMRVARDRRLCHTGYPWALPLLTRSPGARAHYARRRQRGDSYSVAARHLANRFFGILYHCLQRSATTKPRPSHPTSRSRLPPHVRCLHSGHYKLGTDTDRRRIGSRLPSPNSLSPSDHNTHHGGACPHLGQRNTADRIPAHLFRAMPVSGKQARCSFRKENETAWGDDDGI